jgi:hypothetical protein
VVPRPRHAVGERLAQNELAGDSLHPDLGENFRRLALNAGQDDEDVSLLKLEMALSRAAKAV